MADRREGTHFEDDELELMMKRKFRLVLKDNWQATVMIFESSAEARHAKITSSGDTILHIAVSEGKGDVVRQLVGLIPGENVDKVLRAKNEKGNTPLHLAATLGKAAMCKCIAKKDPNLIGATNNDGETPLFSAVRHGKKKAFLCLHEMSPEDAIKNYTYCRRNNGDNILHSAIFEEYFDLAYQIIYLYKNLLNGRNEKGQIPLHVLATKTSAFKSGSRLGIRDKIVYHCVFVDPLAVETLSKEDYEDDSEDKRSSKYYRICVTLFQLLMNIFTMLRTIFRLLINTIKVLVPGGKNNGNPPDVENPNKASRGGSPGGPGSISALLHEGESSNATQITSSEDEPAKDQKLKPQRSGPLPPNYETLSSFKFVMMGLLIVLGFGHTKAQKIKDKKQKHKWAIHIMDKLLDEFEDPLVWNFGAGCSLELLDEDASANLKTSDTTTDAGWSSELYDEDAWKDEDASTNPKTSDTMIRNNNQATNREREKKATNEPEGKRETPLLLAAKNGVTEMVAKILDKFPVAIGDSDSDNKNVVLLAVENRQPLVYDFLVKSTFQKESVFSELDSQGNSALHLAATLGKHKPRRTPGAAFQMQWELKWYKFVKHSMPRQYFVRYNKNDQTAKKVFNETHKYLLKEGSKWLTKTSESCSVVAALIETVAFATSSAVPGGVKQDGTPTLEGRPAFNVFAISSLVALCFSVIALVMFLAILTSRYQEKDFARDLPIKLIIGLSSLFISISAILVSFCSGYFFVVKDNLKAYPVYAVTCLPIMFFAAVQFPLYVDLIKSTFNRVPQLSSK